MTNSFATITREDILSESRIKLCDQDDNLELYCYVNCNSLDSDLVKKSRGIIFDKVTNNLILSTFPYTEELNNLQTVDIEKELQNFNDLTFYDSYEGCVIRMFFYNSRWYVSTTRKLDAYKSKWSSKTSFGELFEQALYNEMKDNVSEALKPVDWLISFLKTDHQYTFLLTNNLENRIVCEYETPRVFHVGTFKDNVLIDEDSSYLPISSPEKKTFRCVSSVLDYVKSVDIFRTQGVVVFFPGNRQLKILNSDYQKLYELRGNEPSIKYRYLQIRMDSEKNRAFRNLYKEHCSQFEEYENLIFDTCMYIYKSYVNRYIKATHVVVPVEEFQVMKAAHELYKRDPKNNKVKYSTILSLLNAQPATRLNKIIRRMKFTLITEQSKEKTDQDQKSLLWETPVEVNVSCA